MGNGLALEFATVFHGLIDIPRRQLLRRQVELVYRLLDELLHPLIKLLHAGGASLAIHEAHERATAVVVLDPLVERDCRNPGLPGMVLDIFARTLAHCQQRSDHIQTLFSLRNLGSSKGQQRWWQG